MTQKPKILKNTVVAKSRLFCVEELNLRFSNGEKRHFERLKKVYQRDSVMMVPMLDKATVLLVKEYGAGIDEYYLGLPKGIVDLGESLKDAANRELMEEIGYGARDLQVLTSLTLSPAYMGHRINVVLAQDLYQEKRQGDEPEELEVVPWSLHRLTALVQRQDFHEARSIAALYMVRDLLYDKHQKTES